MNRFYKGQELQRGFGLGCKYQKGGFDFGKAFRKFFNYVSPFLVKAKNYALPILKSGAQTVGKEVVKTAAEIAKDLVEGKTDTIKPKINASIESLAKQADEKLRGSGSINRKTKHKYIYKKRKSDFFDSK